MMSNKARTLTNRSILL